MSDLPATSKGKIARLPARLREAVCRRLHDGETAGILLHWLNGQTDVVKVLELHFDGEAISPQNLSAWRKGGFQKWLDQREEIEATKERARYSMDLARASGGNISEGALALLTGEVMSMVEQIASALKAGEQINPKLLTAVNKSLVAARAKELDTQILALNEKKVQQKDRELALAEEKFQLQFVETFIKHLDDAKAREIAASPERKEVKMEQLRMHLFGLPPARRAGGAAAA